MTTIHLWHMLCYVFSICIRKHIYIYIYVYVYMCAYPRTHIYIFVYTYTCMYVYTYMYTYLSLSLYLSVFLSLSLYIYVYVYVYMYYTNNYTLRTSTPCSRQTSTQQQLQYNMCRTSTHTEQLYISSHIVSLGHLRYGLALRHIRIHIQHVHMHTNHNYITD